MPASATPTRARRAAPHRVPPAPTLALALALAAVALLARPARAAPGAGLMWLDRQSGPSQSCECPSLSCPLDQTCWGTSGVGFCSTVGLGNPPLTCDGDEEASTEAAPAESLGSGMLCLCPRPDCPLNEICFAIRGAGVCYRIKFSAVFEERTCIPPSVSASPSPSAYPSESAAPGSPSPSATPSISVSPSVSSSPDSALVNPNNGNQGTFTSVASTTPTESAPAVCVAAHHLAHVPAHALVFSVHRSAPVLCDAAGSCATPGHMVVFRGRPMMMRTYCEFAAEAPCTAGATLVNSPRFTRAWRARSHTPELEFTALAARWATPVEEAALTLAVRLGA